ncbi:trypco2 family protein [Bremerella volcania]|nr:trypco2 family protein [Bremerella volcania]
MQEIELVIQQIKRAISDSQSDLSDRNIVIDKVELEINSILKDAPSGAFELEWGPVKFGGGASVSENQVTKIKLSLVPVEIEYELLAPKIHDRLTRSLESLLATVDEANSTPPEFGFQMGSIELSFVITEKSEVKILGLGTKASSSESQRIILHLRPK